MELKQSCKQLDIIVLQFHVVVITQSSCHRSNAQRLDSPSYPRYLSTNIDTGFIPLHSILLSSNFV